MQPALALSAPPALATLSKQGGIALFLDFDGTLVELAPGPDAIQPLPDLSARLERLASRHSGACALVSGRAIDDIESHIGPVAVAAAGSHGAELRSADGSPLGGPALALPEMMESALRSFTTKEDLDFEHKPFGGAIHYRSNPAKGEAADAFAVRLAEEHGWRVQRGKCVVELVAGRGDKGTAVKLLMQQPEFAARKPVFIGDDLTDEAGFAACQKLGGLGILVGQREGSQADYSLGDVSDVHRWLEL